MRRSKSRTVVVENAGANDTIYIKKNERGLPVGVYHRTWVTDDDPASETGMRPIDFKIMDGAIDVEYITQTPEGKVLHCAVSDDRGNINHGVMEAEVLENPQKFNAWGTRIGMVCWQITESRTLMDIKRWMLSQPGAQRVVNNTGYAGYCHDHGVWLADGWSIGSDGQSHQVLPGISTGAIQCRDGFPREFVAPEGVLTARPAGSSSDTDWQAKVADAHGVMRAMVAALRDNLGHHAGAIGLGWLVAGIVRDRIHAENRAFPVAYLHGPRGCGKNVLGETLMKISGVQGMPLKPGRGTTLVGLRDTAADASNVPMWFDDLRNDEEGAVYHTWIRSMFDGNRSVIGNAREPGKKRQIIPRRTLLLSSQSIVGRDAEHTRYVVIQLTPKSIDRSAKVAVDNLTPRAHSAFWRLAATRHMWVDHVGFVRGHYERLLRVRCAGMADRQYFCWSVVLAGLAFAIMPDAQQQIGEAVAADQPDPLPEDILAEVVARAQTAEEMRTDDSSLLGFWNCAETSVARGQCDPATWLKAVKGHDGNWKLCIWVNFLINVLQREMGRNFSFERRLILTEFQSEAGWITNDLSVSIGNVTRRCTAFEFGSLSVPQWVAQLAMKDMPTADVEHAMEQMALFKKDAK